MVQVAARIPPVESEDIGTALAAIVGPEAVVTSPAQLTFYSTDIAGGAPATAEAVVRVGSLDQLSRVVALCSELGRQVIPRGGGFSYTGGYTPAAPETVIVDMRPMNRVVEINAEDMYVVVEAGCTWANLYEALKREGLRTPYFGPMSGYGATVGGALSQGSFFLGSSQYGTVAESVLGLQVVLADGSVLHTGSWGSKEAPAPFFRQYGPDATGLFLGDTGAMGLKAAASLRLIPFPAHQAYGTFAFTDHGSAVAAVSEIGRSGLAAECYCWDPYFVRVMAQSTGGLKNEVGYLWKVAVGGSGLLDGLGAAARMALAGRGAFSGRTWLLHVVIDDATRAGAAGRLNKIRAMARRNGGRDAPPTAPRTLRAAPFTNFNTAERRSTLRNIPTHGLCPHSVARALADDVYALLAQRRVEMERHEVECGVIFFAVGGQALCIEPLIYWRDEHHFLHDRVAEVSDLAALAGARPPERTAFALELRSELKAIFRRHGCVHVQIGRCYPWAETRETTNLNLLNRVKDAVDPRRLVNRGSLGLGAPAEG